jgi:hypothetical protein
VSGCTLLKLWLVTLAAGLVAVSVLTPVSLARTEVASRTPKAMAAEIRGFVPQIPTANTSAPSNITSSACRGLGKPRTTGKGKTAVRHFTTFHCTATWARGKSPIWARVLRGGTFCASATGLAACPAAAPTAGDPRICHDPPAPPTGDPNRCARSKAEAALLRAMRANFSDPNWSLGDVSCDGKNVAWTCTFTQLNVFGVHYSSTIDFAMANSAWTANIAITGGGGTSSCVVQPSANTAAGKPSKWSIGPAPICT